MPKKRHVNNPLSQHKKNSINFDGKNKWSFKLIAKEQQDLFNYFGRFIYHFFKFQLPLNISTQITFFLQVRLFAQYVAWKPLHSDKNYVTYWLINFNGIVLIVLDDELGLDLWCEIGDLWKLITLYFLTEPLGNRSIFWLNF